MMIGGAVALYQFAILNSSIGETTTTSVRQLELAEELLQDTALIRYHGRRFIDLGKTEDQKETLAHIDQINKRLHAAEGLFASDAADANPVAALRTLANTYHKQFDL